MLEGRVSGDDTCKELGQLDGTRSVEMNLFGGRRGRRGEEKGSKTWDLTRSIIDNDNCDVNGSEIIFILETLKFFPLERYDIFLNRSLRDVSIENEWVKIEL